MTDSDMSYEEWMSEVDREVYKEAEVSVHDLEDFNSRDLFDSGLTPAEAAIEALDQDSLYAERDW